MPRATPLVLALIGATLATAAPASAATFCVNSGGTGGCSATIGDAMTKAAQPGAPGRDTITIGAGTYNGPYGLLSANPVDLVGSGPATIVTAASGVVLSVDDPSATVSDLTVKVPNGGLGLGLAGTADHVDVVADPGLVNGTGVTASFFAGGGTFRNGAITLPLVAGTTGASAGPTPGNVTVQDSVVTAGVGLSSGATVLRSVVRAGQGAITPAFPFVTGIKTVIEDSTILTQPVAGLPERGLAAAMGIAGTSTGGTLIARHDTIIGSGSAGSIGVEAKASANPGVISPVEDLTLSNSIVRGYATGLSRTGALAPGLGLADGVANLSAVYSDVSGPVAGTGPGLLTNATVLDTDPRFRDAANGDFRLRGDSPLVDAGDPAGLAVGESATDGAALPRIAGTRTDIGAFEYQGPPVAALSASPALPRTGQPVTFDASGSSSPEGGIAGYAWDLDGNGTFETVTGAVPRATTTFGTAGTHPVTVRVTADDGGTGTRTLQLPVQATPASISPLKIKSLKARRSKKGTTFTFVLSRAGRVKITIYRGTKKVGTLTRTGKAGKNTFLFNGKIGRKRLKRGPYRASLVASDGSGQRSPARSIAFKL